MKHLVVVLLIFIFSFSPFWFTFLAVGLVGDSSGGNSPLAVLPWLIFYTVPTGIVATIGYLIYIVFGRRH